MLWWIKQNLRIKVFYETSKTVVDTQIWIAISLYIVIVIIKKNWIPNIPWLNYYKYLSIGYFEKPELTQAFTRIELDDKIAEILKQLILFDP